MGPAGPTGPAGPAGADGASAVLAYTFLSARQTLAQGSSFVDFTGVHSGSTPAVTHADGTIEIPASGTYRVTYVAAPDAGSTSTISIGASDSSKYWLSHNGSAIDSSVVSRPIFDVNIALILTLRTIVQGGSYSATSYVNAQAGDTLRLESMTTPGIRIPETAFTLVVERIS
ncbi:hypothetical protein [Microbacterium sp. H1-D42]|uniref:hypothetical protein n=1 Tax=Microbacterium sp. H1-D42 TaxID=2925844 RepID=UPI001F533063|nr:hypothetical protein [Microbacterium sp. H1-D42]UNK70663.1 hypothetical protein MNR00_16135 [Microbacterium sp. H1-D42]